MSISVNGKVIGPGKPGSYFSLDRRWSDGDVVDFTLPATLRVRQYLGADQMAGDQRYSVEYGPILLAAVGSSKVHLNVSPEQLVDHLESVADAPLHFNVRAGNGQKLMPYWLISEEEFTCYPSVHTLT